MSGVAVLGAGAWGTALGLHLSEASEAAPLAVRLWGRDRAAVLGLGESRRSAKLPGAVLPPRLRIGAELEQAVSGASTVVLAVTCAGLRGLLEDLGPLLPRAAKLVIATKGIEHPTLLLPSALVRAVLGPEAERRTVILSGPSFAKEVASARPTSLVAAGYAPELAEETQRMFSRRNVRVYTSTDPIGVQVAGALKNVIAIAVGASDGLHLGPNARSALITRGLSEIARLAEAMGGQAATVSGLAGLGDLVLTCTGEQSRNRTVGFRLGQGEALDQVLQSMSEVAEGVTTARSAVGLSESLGVDLPIAREVFEVVVRGRHPEAAMQALMSRSLKSE